MCSVCSTVLRSLYVLSLSLYPSLSLVSPFFILYLVCSVSVFLFSFFVHLVAVAVDFVFIVCRQSAQDKNWYMTADRVCINGKH